MLGPPHECWSRHMNAQPMRAALLVSLSALAMLVGVWLVSSLPAVPAADRVLERIIPARLLPVFVLRGSAAAFTNRSMQGQWWLVAFGYAGCPDVCPTTLAQLVNVRRLIVAAGKTPPSVLFVSVDPRRDTPQLLQNYVAYFSPSFIGVSGAPAQLEVFADALDASFSVHDSAAYAVGHSTAVLLIDPGGRLVARVSPPFAAQQLADELVARTALHGLAPSTLRHTHKGIMARLIAHE